MWNRLLLPFFALSLSATERHSPFEVRGKILPPAAGTVSLQAVASPFAVSTLAGPDGSFRFQNLAAGAYTLAVTVPQRGETRRTVQVGPGTVDKKGRVVMQVEMHDETLHRESAVTLSAQEWKISARAWHEYEEAGRKLAHRDVEGAVACLRRAVEREPRFAAAWNHLGTIAYQTQHYQEAADDFRRGLQADLGAYEPLVNLGGVLLHLGNWEEARQYNREAVQRRPQDALAQSQLGLTYLLLQQLERAETHLLRACQLDPAHFSHPQLHLAEVYVRRNERRRAADQLEDFLHYHPDWATADRLREQIEQWRH